MNELIDVKNQLKRSTHISFYALYKLIQIENKHQDYFQRFQFHFIKQYKYSQTQQKKYIQVQTLNSNFDHHLALVFRTVQRSKYVGYNSSFYFFNPFIIKSQLKYTFLGIWREMQIIQIINLIHPILETLIDFLKLNAFKSKDLLLFDEYRQTEYNYYLAPKNSSRYTSFGIGNRSNAQNLYRTPGPHSYNVSKFPANQRGTSLSCTRKNVIFGSLKHQIERKAQLPSPDTYNKVEMKGKSFSLRKRLPGETEFIVKKRVPGPGQYKTLQLSATGRYISSRNRNTRSISFGVPHTDRPSTSNNTRTGPGSYDIFYLDSNFSDTKVSIMKLNTTRNFGTGSRKAVEDKSKLYMPGPGQYESFSCFGNNFKPRVS